MHDLSCSSGCPCVWYIDIKNFNTLLVDFFLIWICSILPYHLWLVLESFLSDIKVTTWASIFLEFFFLSLLPCDAVYPWSWGIFLGCSRRINPVFKSILLAYLFIEDMSPLMLEISMNSVCWFLLFCCGAGVCVCASPLLFCQSRIIYSLCLL